MGKMKMENPFKKRPRRIGRSTSGDGVAMCAVTGHQRLNLAVWHRKVIADYERWKKNNPGEKS